MLNICEGSVGVIDLSPTYVGVIVLSHTYVGVIGPGSQLISDEIGKALSVTNIPYITYSEFTEMSDQDQLAHDNMFYSATSLNDRAQVLQSCRNISISLLTM